MFHSYAVHKRCHKLSRPAGTSCITVRRRSVWIGRCEARETCLWRGSFGLSSSPDLGIMATWIHLALLWSTIWQGCSVRWSIDRGEAPRSNQEGGRAVVPGQSVWVDRGTQLRQAGDRALFLHAVVGVFRVFIRPACLLAVYSTESIWEGCNHFVKFRRVEVSIRFFYKTRCPWPISLMESRGLIHINEALVI